MGIIEFVIIGAIAPWFGLLLLKPRMLTLLVITLGLVQLSWFTRYFDAPPIFSRVSLVFAAILGIRLVVDHVSRKSYYGIHHQIIGPVLCFSAFFVLLSILSNVVNSENLTLGLYELRYYLFGLVTFMGLYTYYSEILSISFFKKCLILIGLVQIPISIVKWLAAGGGQVRTLDSVTGSFSGYGELVACQLLVICILLFEQLTTKNILFKINNYLLSIILLIPVLLSKSRTATVFIFMAIIFTWLLSTIRNKNFALALKLALKVSFIGAIISGLLFQLFWKDNYDLERQFNPDYVLDYFMQDPVTDYERYRQGADPVMGRFRAVVEAIKLINVTPVNFLIGYGSGATAEASFLQTPGKFYQEYGPLAGLGRNHYSKTLAELGFIGLVGFVFFFYIICKRLKDSFAFHLELTSTFFLILFILAILSVYGPTLASFFFSFIIAFFLATAQVEIDRGPYVRL